MRLFLLLLLLWPLAAQAAPPLTVSYQGTLHGVAMVTIDATLRQDNAGYTVRTALRTVGAFARLVRGRSDVVAQGAWRGNAAAPTHLDSEGYWDGRQRRMIVDTVAGTPTIRLMVPPQPARRGALTRDDIAGTVDALGLFVALMREVAATGKCDANARVFDGHGVVAFSMTTAGSTALQAGETAYPGLALRCEFATRKVAGLRADDDPGRTDHGIALFRAPAPGLPPLPVRIVFQRGWLGEAVLALTAAHEAG